MAPAYVGPRIGIRGRTSRQLHDDYAAIAAMKGSSIMPKTDKAKAAPVVLPALDSIESVEPTALPESTRGAMSADEKALAEAIIAANVGGNVARGPKVADRKAAATVAARMKRLLGSFYRHAGIAAADRPTIKTRVVPRDDGFAWTIAIVAASAEPAEDAAAAE